MQLVFVYQTLLDKETRKDVIGREVHYKVGILPKYKEVDKGDGYHTIIKDENSNVKGEILFLNEDELEKLDDYESKYHRKRLKTIDFETNGDRLTWVYILNFS